MPETILEPAEQGEIARTLARIPTFAGTTLDRPAIERIGGLTNCNYKVSVGPESYVLRLAGAGTAAYIDRQAEAHNAKVAAAAGVNAQVLFFDVADGTMLCRYVDDCLTMSADTFQDLGRVERAAHAFRRMHEHPEPFAGRFEVFAQIDEYLGLLRRNEARIPDGYDALQRQAETTRRVLAERPARLAPCHNDPLAENFLDAAAVLAKGLCDLVWTLWGLLQVMNDTPPRTSGPIRSTASSAASG